MEISRLVCSSLDIREEYERVAEQVQRLIPFDRITISEFDVESDTITPVYIAGLQVAGWETGAPHPIDMSRLGPVIRERQSLVFDEDSTKEHAAANSDTAAGASVGLTTGIAVPLVYRDCVIGVLNLSAFDPAAYTVDDVELVERIASHVSAAIANAHLYQQTLSQAEELARRDVERSRFLSTVSHELRTPLTPIVAFADILAQNREGNFTARQIEQIAAMQRNGRRLEVLITDLADLSRITDGEFGLERREFQVWELLVEVAAEVSPLVDAKDQSIEVSIPASPAWIEADRVRIAQVVSNLLSNACKYSPEQAVIGLRGRSESGKVIVTVEDEGIGISEEDQAQLFSPFFRAENIGTQSQSGTGLGLVIVKSIVELHGGSISVESTPGDGTTVRFVLPDVASAPSDRYLEVQRAASGPPAPHSRLDLI